MGTREEHSVESALRRLKLKRLIADPLQRSKYNLSEIRSNDRIDLKIPIVSFVDLGGS